MWTALLDGTWNSLAIVPVDGGVSTDAVVEALGIVSNRTSPAVHCLDARGAEIAEAKRMAGELPTLAGGGARSVVVVASLIQSLSGIHIIQKVDAVLLVVRVGSFDLDALASTVAMVGPGRIVGSVTSSAEPP